MPKKLSDDFSDTRQDRSKKTLDDLLQAAYEIVEAADPSTFTSRALANKAGYSLGTLSQRLGSVENVFFWAIQKGRDLKLKDYGEAMRKFDPQLTIYDFVETFVDKAFNSINAVSPAVMRFYERRITQKHGLTPDYFDYIDVLNEPYFELCKNNKTNTFRIFSREEIRLIFKSILTLMERPYITGDPIAGTKEHRRLAVDSITRLLAIQ